MGTSRNFLDFYNSYNADIKEDLSITYNLEVSTLVWARLIKILVGTIGII